MQDVLGWSHDSDGRDFPQTSGTSASLRMYSSYIRCNPAVGRYVIT